MSFQPAATEPRGTSSAVDNTFFITVIAKGVGGFLELVAGLGLLFIDTATLQRLLEPFTHLGLDISHISAQAKLFTVFYFSIRGFVRVLLAIALLKERLWAYPVAIVLLGSAVLYQAWLLVSGHFSWGMVFLTLFDLVIIGLTLIEFRKLRSGGHLSRPHL
jgi:uncharacterized membrane protein